MLTNKYAEGYPKNRYYSGCHLVDEIEEIAIKRCKKLFNAQFANVQPNSGSQANQSAFFALLEPHDLILGMSLDSGGHLTHGSKVNISGKWFKSLSYSVDKDSGLIDYDQIAYIAKSYKPKLIVAGCSSYPRTLDFAKFRAIADSIGAYLMVDMAHFAGLVATNLYPNPLPHAHIVTSTTHKTLRGPRGGIVLTNHMDIAKAIDKAIFPGIQGGPLMHVIAGKAVAFGEALDPSYREYMCNVIKNAQLISSILESRGYNIVTGGTDCHLLVVNLKSKKLTGLKAEQSLERAGLSCNKNTIPFDNKKATITSGIRIGTPAATTRGLGNEEFTEISHMIADVLDGLRMNPKDNSKIESIVREKVLKICEKFPIYKEYLI